MNTLRAAGVSITPENLKISDRASLLLPWHRDLDGLEEARLADKKYGSTKQGIAPFYSDKYQKKTVMAGELLHPQHLKEHLADLLEWKNLTLQKVYGAKGYTLDELLAWVDKYCEAVKPYITNTLKPSWAPSGTWTTAFIPIPPPPTLWRPMRRWVPVCPPPSWTKWSAW